MRATRLLLLVGGLCVPLPAAAAPEPLATIVNCRGKVTVMGRGGKRAAAVGMNVGAGDEVTTGADGWAWLVHQKGALERLGPGKTVRLGKSAPRRKPGRIAALLQKLGLFAKAEQGQLGNKGGGVRPAGEQRFFVVSPRRSYVDSQTPTLRWTPMPGAAAYRVTLAALAKDLMVQRVKATELVLGSKTQPLRRGELHFLTVEALSKAGGVVAHDRTTFTVASKDTAEELQRLAEELRGAFAADGPTARLMVAELYLKKTFYAEALDLFEGLARQPSATPWVHARVATIRELVGLPPEARAH